jgi:hypothetical protein
MSYIYSIKNGVDERMLSSAIEKYRKYKENTFPDVYIFLNKKTFDDLYWSKTDCNLGFLCYYQGCKMFEDNTLDYGEVELK